ncbi:phytoene desaturase family protein [Streptomyces sp. H27-D2]|uniref:phytoene desaturase family protein n=1 Tax=Streptomyces sp. H27-D2 TaxID=3046304 RepID=UPI002DB89969|nr:NAD(P)/FAD-dependent oxidoreductase [Streptomyces sp. H27-D2]MEC4018932.1 NAD(P)/FAD-dependent oxidoreductase [Streptomyces sp. H27-D2]
MARIAVIGAGMGAMAAAARLAVAGHRVAVHERAGGYGGAVGRFERGGFAFDTGPGLLHLPAVYRDLFVKTGKEPLERCVELTQVDPASRHVFADGTELSLPNASRAGVVEALDAALGAGAGERWSELIQRAREVWDATRRPLLEEPLPADPAALRLDPYPAPRKRGWLGRGKRPGSLAEVAALELRDPRLVALLESYALAYGFHPGSAPPSATVLPYLEQTFGSWYASGGMRALADALYERCLARKVTFSFGSEVVGIVEKDGRAAGVELSDGTVVEADSVVAGIDPWHLKALLGGGAAARPTSPARAAASVTPTAVTPTAVTPVPLGRLVVCLALRGARPEGTAHRTVIHAADGKAESAALSRGELCERPTVTVLRPDDADLVPDAAHEAITLTVTVPAHGPVEWRAPGQADGYADRVLAAAGAAVPGLRERVLWREVRTPADTEAATGATGGAVPGPSLAGADGRLLHPSNVGRLPGLYPVGGWSHPGGGLAHAGMSGAMVAGLIVSGDDWRGSQ